jgi:hypothetical protein
LVWFEKQAKEKKTVFLFLLPKVAAINCTILNIAAVLD